MAEPKMQLEDWLDDLCVRFIINLPQEDLSSVARICFQVEEAQWFYEDFIRPLDPALPSMPLKSFCLRIFQHCPLLSSFSHDNHMKAFDEFLQYKTRVPVRGAIMLNEAMDSVVLVKGWKKGANWSFPRGKINKDEDDLDCAIREVYEETGYDIQAAGLVPADRNVKYIEMAIREQHMRLYVFRNVPMDTPFEPKTRKEISKIEWYRLSDLPAFRKKNQQSGNPDVVASNANKFYMVAPFLVPLKKWIVQQLKKEAQQKAVSNQHLAVLTATEDALTEEEAIESSTEQPRKSNANMDTLEGATAALQRLLKIQPATQGLQSELTPTQPTSDSGGALLALLNGQNNGAASQPSNPIPQTPMELIYDQPPMPKTPHHHRPQPMPFANFPQPPNFSQQFQNHAQAPPHQQPPVYAQFPGQNAPPPMQGFPFPMRNPAGFQPHLQHPQPLPPQVQSSLFTAANAPLSVPQQTPIQQPAPQQPSGIPNFMAPSQFNANVPPQQPQQPQHGHKLTNHSLSLLNAFKGGPNAAELANSSQEAPTRVVQQTQITQEQHNTYGQVPATNPLRPPVNADHQKALLGLFKQPAPVVEQNAQTSTFVQSTTVHELPAPEIEHAHPKPAADTSKPIEILSRTPKAEQFRPTQILTRPQATPPRSPDVSSGARSSPRQPKQAHKASPKSRGNKGEGEKVLQKPFQPQILKRPQASSPLAPQTQKPSAEPAVNNQALLDLFKQPTVERRPSQVSQASPPPVQRNPSISLGNSQTLLDIFKQGPAERRPSQLSPKASITAGAQRTPSTSVAPNMSLLELLKQPSERRPSQTSQVGSPLLAQRNPSVTSTQSQNLLGLLKQPSAGTPVLQASPVTKPVQPAQQNLDQQKRNLLSMFGNGSPAQASFDTASHVSPINPQNDVLKNALARSRVGSLAGIEVGSAQESRRGSQTPISPADEAFLLGYLEQAAKASGR